eukprot:sb/3469839/
MKVTSKLKERAAIAAKNIKVDYTNMTTINTSFEQLINRQLVFLTMSKKLNREAQENDEKLRKIQLFMTRCVKELSEDKEQLFHKNHLLDNENTKLMEKVKLMSEEIEFYHNKEGLLKHQANVEAGKNIQALELELELLREQHEKVAIVTLKLGKSSLKLIISPCTYAHGYNTLWIHHQLYTTCTTPELNHTSHHYHLHHYHRHCYHYTACRTGQTSSYS